VELQIVVNPLYVKMLQISSEVKVVINFVGLKIVYGLKEMRVDVIIRE